MSTIRRKAINVFLILVVIFCFVHTFIVVTFFTNDKIIKNTNFKLHSVNTQSELLNEFDDLNYSGIVKIFDTAEKINSSNINSDTNNAENNTDIENNVVEDSNSSEITVSTPETTSSYANSPISNVDSSSYYTSNSASSSTFDISIGNYTSSSTSIREPSSHEVSVRKETNVTQNTQESKEIKNNLNTQTVQSSYYGYSSIGKIQIPKTGVNLPILEKVSVSGMEIASCFLYSTGALNQSGNTLIVAHNYMNGKLFSNNYKLQLGDVIYITTLDGKTLEYTIYEKFITTPEDIAYIKKNDSSVPGIALSTCTNDEKSRLVILAKAL